MKHVDCRTGADDDGLSTGGLRIPGLTTVRAFGLCGLPCWIALNVSAAFAGPPYNVEFAEPIEYGHTEIDLYADTTHAKGNTSADLPGIQIDYGAVPNGLVRVALPLAFSQSEGNSAAYGIGDAQLGFEYQLFQGGGWWPQVSIFPLVLAPTGDRRRGLGQGHATYSFPLWLQESFGPWKVYGGGGYSVNSDANNSWFGGIATQRRVSDTLTLGGMIFHGATRSIGAPAGTTLSLTGSYDISKSYHIYFSVGRSIQDPSKTNEITAYSAFALTF